MKRMTKYLFIAPLIAFFVFMAAYPIAYMVRVSFCEWSLGLGQDMKWVGLENYIYALKNEDFWMSGLRTFIFAFWAVGIEIILGVALALFIGNRRSVGTTIVKTGFLLPMVATPVAVALTWKLLFDNNFGLINFLLKKIGLSYAAFSSVDTVLSAYIIVDIWQWTPFVMLMALAGLSTLPGDCYEAAKIDGASRWQSLWKITLPLLSPTIMMTMTLRLIDALKAFDIIYAVTGGGPGDAAKTLNILLYNEAFSNFRFGRAAAYIILFCIMIVAVAFIFTKIKKKVEVDY